MAPPFIGVLDTLYRYVFDHMPEAVQERGIANSFFAGGLVTYGAVRGLQWASHQVDRVVPGFEEHWLPKLERVSIAVVVGVPLLYAVVDPEGAKRIWTTHPAYTSGLLGIATGGITGAAQDLHRRSIDDALERSSLRSSRDDQSPENETSETTS